MIEFHYSKKGVNNRTAEKNLLTDSLFLFALTKSMTQRCRDMHKGRRSYIRGDVLLHFDQSTNFHRSDIRCFSVSHDSCEYSKELYLQKFSFSNFCDEGLFRTFQWVFISLLVVVAAKPNVPSVILSTNDVSSVATGSSDNAVFSQTIEAHKTNIIHDYRPLDNSVLSNGYLKHEQETNYPNAQLVRKHVATPYGHHGFNLGHIGSLFNPHHGLGGSYL